MSFTTVVIHRSRRKTVFGFLFSAVFVALSWWMWNKKPGDNAFRDWEAKIFAPIGMVFFSITGVYLLVKLFDRTPALILDEAGIHDRSSMVGYLHVPWEQVSDVSETRMKKVRLLLVHLRDPQAFLAPMKAWRKWSLGWNLEQRGTPFVLAANALQCDFDELRGMIEAGIRANAGRR